MNFLGIQEIATTLQNIIAPPRCLNCLQEDTWYCADCRRRARLGELSCIVCKTKQTRGLTCSACRKQTPIYGLLTVDTYHAPALRRGVHWLKFKHVRAVAPVLAHMLLPRLTHIAPPALLQEQAVLVPIPLHPRRLRERGFNQSEDIARALSAYTGIPVRPLLTRRKATHAQAKLPTDLRQKNITEAFEARPLTKDEVEGVKYFILIDDVATSGATLTAAAHALLPHIPLSTQVWAAAVARG